MALGCPGARAAETKAADRALPESGVYPAQVGRAQVDPESFPGLKVEGIAGKLKFSFQSDKLGPKTAVSLWASVDSPGHWPARRWISIPMKQAGRDRVAKWPVDAVDVPVVYFVEAQTLAGPRHSPLRICEPRGVGIERPSRPFWSFLDGFETGLGAWQDLSGNARGGGVKIVERPLNGRHALSARIPADKASVSFGTTAVREWHVRLKGARGVRFHARSVSGSGRLRLTAYANAFTEAQQVSEMRQTIRIGQDWKQSDVFFSEFPGLNLNQIDLVAFEFVGAPGAEFLLDDLRLLGDWATER